MKGGTLRWLGYMMSMDNDEFVKRIYEGSIERKYVKGMNVYLFASLHTTERMCRH